MPPGLSEFLLLIPARTIMPVPVSYTHLDVYKRQELGIERSVRFAGMVNPNDVAAYYKLGDIFTWASTSETQGLTYIEAMASGLRCV